MAIRRTIADRAFGQVDGPPTCAPVGGAADAPAAYVRSEDLRVERLEQRYVRLQSKASGPRFHYEAPVFNFECELAYDDSGLLLDYPGIAVRAA